MVRLVGMKVSITQKISGLLLAAVCGAIVTGVVSYSYFVQTEDDASTINVAGRQRMLSRMLFEYATMVHGGQDEDRETLRLFIAEFDQALEALHAGGTVLNRTLLPAPVEAHEDIQATKQLWGQMKKALLVIADQPVDTPEAVEAFLFVTSSIDQLTDDADKIVTALEARSLRLKRNSKLVIVLTVIFDLALLVIGFWTVRRYIRYKKKASNELEANNRMFQALDKINRAFISDTDYESTFEMMLEYVLELSQSEYGFIGQVLHKPDGAPYLKTQAVTNIAWNDETRIFYDENIEGGLEFSNPKTLIGAVMTSGRTVITNEPGTDPRRGGLPKGHPPLDAFLGLPILRHGTIIGMVGVSNRPCGYDDDLVEYLQPILATCGGLIDAYGSMRQRQQAEDELIESETRYQELIDSVLEGICTTDENEIILFCNPAFASIFGEDSPDAVVGKNFLNYLSENEISKVLAETEKRKKGESSQYELQITTPTGEKKTILTWVKPKFDKEMNFVSSLCAITDITERKVAEDALRESEEAYRLVLENTDTGFVVVDEAGIVLEANESYLRLIGVEKLDDIIGHSVIEWTAPESQEENTKAVARCVEQGHIEDFETTYLLKDGRRVIVLINGIMHETATGIRLSTQCRDITERRKAEERVAHWAAFARYNPAPVLSTDSHGKITLANPAAKQLLGREVIGELITSVLSSAGDLFDRFNPTNLSVHIEQKLGDEIYLFSFQVDDSTSSIYVYGNNITETKRLQELESRAARLETAGTIAGQVAHDFNNLLAPIMAYPEFIHAELPEGHKAHVYLDAIENAATKIADINQDLLTMGRRGHYDQEVLDLNAIILQAAHEIQNRAKTLSIETNLCPDLLSVKGGIAQIHRMITNLLLNAQDAMDDGGQITIVTENYYADDVLLAFGRVPKGEFVKVTISDTGCGIPEEIIQKILDPFFSTKMTDKKRGSGLGLSIVDSVLRDHGGYLDLDSKVGEGTSFYLYFPVTRELISTAEGEMEIASGGTESILVIDDDDIQRVVCTELLTRLGYQVTSVASGEKAIDLLKQTAHDLLILDMIMPPGIDGTETYKRILKINPDQRAIIVSGFSETSQVTEAQNLGAGQYVKKPLSMAAIAVAVRTELDRKRQSAPV